MALFIFIPNPIIFSTSSSILLFPKDKYCNLSIPNKKLLANLTILSSARPSNSKSKSNYGIYTES